MHSGSFLLTRRLLMAAGLFWPHAELSARIGAHARCDLAALQMAIRESNIALQGNPEWKDQIYSMTATRRTAAT